jgi:hypothetical protein
MPSEDPAIKPRYIRTVLNMFSLGASSGYGQTNFKQDLSAYAIWSENGQLYLIDRSEGMPGEVVRGVSNWLTNPIVNDPLILNSRYDVPLFPLINPVDNPILRNTGVLVTDDEDRIIFSDRAGSVPLTVYLNFDYQRIFRIGVGATFEWQSSAVLKPRNHAALLPNYMPDYNSVLNRYYFINAGYKYHDWWDYSFVADLRIGRFRMGNAFNQEILAHSTYVNIGLPVERNLSEYFRLVVRPSVDVKRINTIMPENFGVLGTSLVSFNLGIGVEVNYPKYPPCIIDACRTQKEHTHFSKKYRGQPIYKKQNPMVGEDYKRLKSQRKSTIEMVSGNIGRIFEKKPRRYSSNLFKLRP